MLSFFDWIDAVRFRWKFVIFVTTLVLLSAILYLLIAPRVYQASSSVLVDTRADPMREGPLNDAQANNRELIATQADLIRSPSVSDLAAASAGLDKDSRFREGWFTDTKGRTPYADWLRKRLMDGLTVVPGKDSSILVIQAEATTPGDAARIANGYARAAVEAQYRLRTGPAKNYADWLAHRLMTARAEVIQSQTALSQFARAAGILNDGDTNAEGTQMAQVETQLATAEARAAAAGGLTYSAPQSRGDAEKSDTIQGLRRQVAEASSRLAKLQATFGPEYPDVKSARAELVTLEKDMNRELRSSVHAFDAARSAQAASERDAAFASEERLRSLASRQRTRVETIGANMAQYQRLKNEFGVAQKNFNDINDKLERMRLQGSLPQTELQVLDFASVPLLPSSPKVLMTLFLAILLGLISGALGAIIFETFDPRVRSWSGVERLLGTPVISMLTLPKADAQGFLLASRGGN
ncbi:MAG: hypothetical protein NVS3B5_08310 [Sphingomicrobium sp.]